MISKLDFLDMKYKFLYNSFKLFNKNNSQTELYKQEGLKILSNKVDKLPEKIAFRPKWIKKSSCVKVLDNMYLFISKSNLYKPLESRFDSFFHEAGHWLHFQDMPALAERKAIWKGADWGKINKDVSKRATESDDGTEFVAEVFKGLIKGETYDDYIMNLYYHLKGPKVKQ